MRRHTNAYRNEKISTTGIRLIKQAEEKNLPIYSHSLNIEVGVNHIFTAQPFRGSALKRNIRAEKWK